MLESVRFAFRVPPFLILLCVSAASAQEGTFEHLVRSKFTALQSIDGISTDGSRVVATFYKSSEESFRPVAWDAAGTGRFLGLLPQPGNAVPHMASFRQTISADGSLIGGYCDTYAAPSGFYGYPPVSWDADGAIRQLESPFVGSSVSYSGYVSAVSPNGAYLYGWCQVPPTGYCRPFRWNADGSVEALRVLGTDADGFTRGQADLCSGDGSVVVGWLDKYSSTGAYLKQVNVCWLGDERPIELPGAHLR